MGGEYKMICSKKKYKDEHSAKVVYKGKGKNKNHWDDYGYAYKCKNCGYYHITE